MSVLQELIVKFNKNKNQELYIRIIKEIQSIDKIWIAFSTASNNYFLGNENGKAAAYIFSEKEYFDKYYVHLQKKGDEIKAVENSKEYRMAFFGDLFRCGFENIVIDNGQTFLNISMSDIVQIPDKDKMPKDSRYVLNPSLMRTINWFMQENAKGTAGQKMWQLLFSEIFQGEYIIPADTSKLKTSGNEIDVNNSQVSFPLLQNSEGKRYYPFFTDWNELRKYDMKSQFTGMVGGFKDMKAFAGKADGIVINPYGANIVLTSDMLNDIVKVSNDYKKENSEIMVGDPKNYPLEMLRKISEVLWDKENVTAAYLKLMLKDGKESYLVALEGNLPENPIELFNEIAEKALPFADKMPIDFIDYSSDFAKKAFKGASAFYNKK
ncbi:enhanced serine sensitivity protein SseB C-terminal domain-containing protein [Porcipelethomonas sp.]|uniref:enhanced serine sensitivity protein SseB C-terminal domain-containing protein n=1 Tax=Porcipelethomonas sp. TaxID=2981675 RepID=UPI003EF40A9B